MTARLVGLGPIANIVITVTRSRPVQLGRTTHPQLAFSKLGRHECTVTLATSGASSDADPVDLHQTRSPSPVLCVSRPGRATGMTSCREFVDGSVLSFDSDPRIRFEVHLKSVAKALVPVPEYRHYPNVWEGERAPTLSCHFSQVLSHLQMPQIFLDLAVSHGLLVAYDGFPKARRHLLVVPADRHVPSDVRKLSSAHLPLLREMLDVATHLATQLPALEPPFRMLMGFHSLPSLHQLHMHVISTDFDSPCLKTKAHYNSFTTPFLRPPEAVIHELEQDGEVDYSDDEVAAFHRQPLVCLNCGQPLQTMPLLKQHLPCRQLQKASGNSLVR